MMKYDEIANYIIDKIKDGTYDASDKIQSENQLANEFSVSRMTARKAIETCINRGYLYSVKGKGTFVVDESKKFEIDLNDISGFTKRTLDLGMTPRSEVLSINNKPADTLIKEKFSSDIEEVLYLERVRYVNDKPLAIEYSYVNEKYISEISVKDIINSFEDYLHSKGLKIKHIKKEMKAVIPNNTIMNMLKIESNTPIIRVDFYNYLENGDLLQYAKVFYNQDLFKFVQVIDC